MNTIHVRPAVSLAAFTALALAACGVAGDNENLSFSFPGVSSSDDNVIAVESTLRVSASRFGQNEDSDDVELVSVTSADPSVVAVGNIQGDQVLLDGVSEGSAEIEFTATSLTSGETLIDTYTFSVEAPASVETWHDCLDDKAQRHALFLPGGTMDVRFELTSATSNRLVGVGYNPVAVDTLVGATYVDLVERAWGKAVVMTAGEAGAAVSFDLKVGANDLTAEVIDLATIDGAEVSGWNSALTLDIIPPIVGDDNPVRLRPTRAGDRVCADVAVTSVASASPTICEAAIADAAFLSDYESFVDVDAMWLDVDGLAAGTCALDVQLDGLAAPVRVTFDILPE